MDRRCDPRFAAATAGRNLTAKEPAEAAAKSMPSRGRAGEHTANCTTEYIRQCHRNEVNSVACIRGEPLSLHYSRTKKLRYGVLIRIGRFL